MAIESTSTERAIDPGLYEELYQRYFEGNPRSLEGHFYGDLEASRLEDISDTYAKCAAGIDALFPDSDDMTRRKILAVCSFFERMGCESGIIFARGNMTLSTESASFQRRVTEGF